MPSAYNNGKKLDDSEQVAAARKSSSSANINNDVTSGTSLQQQQQQQQQHQQVQAQYYQEVQNLRHQRQLKLQKLLRQNQQQRIQQQLSYQAVASTLPIPQVAAYYAMPPPTVSSPHQNQLVVGKYILQYLPNIPNYQALQQGVAISSNHVAGLGHVPVSAMNPAGAPSAVHVPVIPSPVTSLNAAGAHPGTLNVNGIGANVNNSAAGFHLNESLKRRLIASGDLVDLSAANRLSPSRSGSMMMNNNNVDISRASDNAMDNLERSPLVQNEVSSPDRNKNSIPVPKPLEEDAGVVESSSSDDEVIHIETIQSPSKDQKESPEDILVREATEYLEAEKHTTTSTPERNQLVTKPFQNGFVVPTDISDIVSRASSLVADEIRCYHYHDHAKYSNDGDTTSEEDDDVEAVRSATLHSQRRAYSAAAALEQFASEVILPGILSSHAASLDFDAMYPSPMPPDKVSLDDEHDASDPNPNPHPPDSDEADSASQSRLLGRKRRRMQSQKLGRRVFIASLLSLREVLSINAAKIFGLERDTEVESKEGYTLQVQSLTTALILNAIMRLQANDAAQREDDQIEKQQSREIEEITKEFLRAATGYDEAEEEFTSCAKRIDSRAIGITPGGKFLKKTENMAWRGSHNTARLHHPLVVRKSDDRTCSLRKVKIPSSNAAFVCMVEKVVEAPSAAAKGHEVVPNGPKKNKRDLLERYKKRIKAVVD